MIMKGEDWQQGRTLTQPREEIAPHAALEVYRLLLLAERLWSRHAVRGLGDTQNLKSQTERSAPPKTASSTPDAAIAFARESLSAFNQAPMDPRPPQKSLELLL